MAMGKKKAEFYAYWEFIEQIAKKCSFWVLLQYNVKKFPAYNLEYFCIVDNWSALNFDPYKIYA